MCSNNSENRCSSFGSLESKNLKVLTRGTIRKIINTSSSIFVSTFVYTSIVNASPIFVYKEADGTVRFTNKPSAGAKAKVFSSKSSAFSYYKFSPYKNSSISSKTFDFNKYEDIIVGASKTHQVDVALLKAVIHAESSLNPRAVSRCGAIGLMQLMPDTAKWLGVKKPFTAEENIHGGAKYLAKLMKKYDGNLMYVLAAYNAGEVNVAKYRGVPPFNETKNYVKKVMALKQKYAEEISNRG